MRTASSPPHRSAPCAAPRPRPSAADEYERLLKSEARTLIMPTSYQRVGEYRALIEMAVHGTHTRHARLSNG